MHRLVIISILFLLLTPLNSSAARFKACLSNKTGKILIKRRCSASKEQQQLSAELLQGLGATQVGPQGPTGPQGPAGPQGEQGLSGADALTDFEVVEDDTGTFSLVAGGTFVRTTLCPAGKTVIAGGCDARGNNMILKSSVLNPDQTGWFCHAQNMSNLQINNARVVTRVHCGVVN